MRRRETRLDTWPGLKKLELDMAGAWGEDASQLAVELQLFGSWVKPVKSGWQHFELGIQPTIFCFFGKDWMEAFQAGAARPGSSLSLH